VEDIILFAKDRAMNFMMMLIFSEIKLGIRQYLLAGGCAIVNRGRVLFKGSIVPSIKTVTNAAEEMRWADTKFGFPMKLPMKWGSWLRLLTPWQKRLPERLNIEIAPCRFPQQCFIRIIKTLLSGFVKKT
jgi:hypothetical protein